MNDFILFTIEQWKVFILVLLRISGLLFLMPFLGARTIPRQVQVSFALILSIILFPVLPQKIFQIPDTLGGYFVGAFMEFSLGVLLGAALFVYFTAFQMAGYLIGTSIGFALANVIDPLTQQQSSIFGQLFFLFATLIFLMVDGHHIMIRSLAQTFDLIPLGGMVFGKPIVDMFSAHFFGTIFIVGLRISAPVVVALLLASIAMGFMARTVPEMNIFIIGFALRIFVGFFLVIYLVPHLARIMGTLTQQMDRDLSTLLRLMSPT